MLAASSAPPLRGPAGCRGPTPSAGECRGRTGAARSCPPLDACPASARGGREPAHRQRAPLAAAAAMPAPVARPRSGTSGASPPGYRGCAGSPASYRGRCRPLTAAGRPWRLGSPPAVTAPRWPQQQRCAGGAASHARDRKVAGAHRVGTIGAPPPQGTRGVPAVHASLRAAYRGRRRLQAVNRRWTLRSGLTRGPTSSRRCRRASRRSALRRVTAAGYAWRALSVRKARPLIASDLYASWPMNLRETPDTPRTQSPVFAPEARTA